MTKQNRTFSYKPPQNIPLEILHEDHQILIVSKPAGLLSVPGKGQGHDDCLESRVKEAFPDARIVHRLDMATSGLMVLARNAEVHRNLGLQFERRKTKKEYIACVWGHLKEDKGEISLPLICDWPNRPKQKVDFVEGREAITNWEVDSREDNYTKIRLFPITGRSHQLRVHMMSIGHPILGDEFYANDEAYEASDRLLLHAYSLAFYHPKDGQFCSFVSPCQF